MAPVSDLLLRAPVARNDHLLVALLISVAVHAAVLTLRFARPADPVVARPTLEVALVNTETELAPLDPQILAQSNLLGGGDDAHGVSTTPLPFTSAATPDEIVLAALSARQRELEAEQQALLTRVESRQQALQAYVRDDATQDADAPGHDEREQESLILSSRIAAIKERIARYNARPRQTFTGPSAQADAYARYLESWRTHIEQLGTEHYPDQARGRVYGSLQLTVYIRRDGTLARVEIDRPSNHAILNLAAQRIVQLAAPFAPLPPEIARDTDVLAITRTWNFQNRQLETRIP